LLANNFSEGAPVIWRPSQDELLCALGFGFLENQPDTFELLWLVEQQSGSCLRLTVRERTGNTTRPMQPGPAASQEQELMRHFWPSHW
jgi:hypothetical protein